MKWHRAVALVATTALAVASVRGAVAESPGEPGSESEPPSLPAEGIGHTSGPSKEALQMAATPTTPTQMLPGQKANVPPPVTYLAYLRNISGAVPPRLGGWQCSGPKCTLTTTGPATQARVLELCRKLRILGLGQGRPYKFAVNQFQAENGPSLNSTDITACNQAR